MRHWLSCAIFTGLISLRPLLKPVMFLLVPTRKNLPVFLPGKRSVPSSKRSFSPSALGAGITHYTLQAKSCAKGTLSPLDSLPRNRRFLWILPAKKGFRPPLESTRKAKTGCARFASTFRFCFARDTELPDAVSLWYHTEARISVLYRFGIKVIPFCGVILLSFFVILITP